MNTVTMKVEVDLEEILTTDLIGELKFRDLDGGEKQELLESMGIDIQIDFEEISLVDKEKFDFLCNNFNDITLEQLEALVK